MATVKLVPLADRVLVAPEEVEQLESGLFIPQNAQETPQKGTVLRVGPGKFENGTQRALSVKPGDKVIFGKYSGTKIKVDHKEILCMREEDIMAIEE